MPAQARSRTPAAAVCAISGSPEDTPTRTTPAINATPVQRGSTPARMTASPKAEPAITITPPWMITELPNRSDSATQSVVLFTIANTTREEHEAVRVSDRADETEPPDPRPLHHVQPDHEERDRPLRHAGERKLRGREAALGELDQIGEEVEG